jgi:hypothetical protein
VLESVLQFAPLQIVNLCVSALFGALLVYHVQHLSRVAVLS